MFNLFFNRALALLFLIKFTLIDFRAKRQTNCPIRQFGDDIADFADGRASVWQLHDNLIMDVHDDGIAALLQRIQGMYQ